MTYDEPKYDSYHSPTFDEESRYKTAKNLNDYLIKTYYNGNNQRWEFSE